MAIDCNTVLKLYYLEINKQNNYLLKNQVET